MLIKIITAISLIKFLLLMISGMDIATALYRSLIVFMILFTVVYLAIFFMNIIRENPETKKGTGSSQMGNQTNNVNTENG